MKTVEIKKGCHTIYKTVPDDWTEDSDKEVKQRELTLGGATCFSFGMSAEDYNRIFGGKNGGNRNKTG